MLMQCKHIVKTFCKVCLHVCQIRSMAQISYSMRIHVNIINTTNELTLYNLEEVLVRTEIPGGGGKGRQYLTLHCHHHSDFCFKMGSDERRFNDSLTLREPVWPSGKELG